VIPSLQVRWILFCCYGNPRYRQTFLMVSIWRAVFLTISRPPSSNPVDPVERRAVRRLIRNCKQRRMDWALILRNEEQPFGGEVASLRACWQCRFVFSSTNHLRFHIEVAVVKVKLKNWLSRFCDVISNDTANSFESNEYNGRKSLQLNLKDVKPFGCSD